VQERRFIPAIVSSDGSRNFPSIVPRLDEDSPVTHATSPAGSMCFASRRPAAVLPERPIAQCVIDPDGVAAPLPDLAILEELPSPTEIRRCLTAPAGFYMTRPWL
jgi:hypothetical protein